MRACIYNPYLDTLGGGERYTLSFAKVLSDLGWLVDLQWQDNKIKKAVKDRFNIDINKINLVDDIKRGDGYDLCFWVSDGSIPTLRARKNILHFQVPFQNVNGKSLLNKMKMFRINKFVCNSEFTKKIVDKEYGINSIVIYPPVDVAKIKPKRKQNIILYVGRFSQLVQNKGQEILIKAFKKFYDLGLKNWKLILAGGIEIGSVEVLKKLKEISNDYPIEIVESPDNKKIIDLYAISKFFWSASGYGVNSASDPQKMEHFGMTTVEAMAGGCVPIVFNGGGQREIIVDGINGFVWEKENEMIKKTKEILKSNNIYQNISKAAINFSQKYSYEEFKNQIIQLL